MLNNDFLSQLFTGIRNLPVYKNQDYVNWFKTNVCKAGEDAHHLFGSMGALKLNDMFLINLPRFEHNKADLNRKAFVEKYFVVSLGHYLNYLKSL